MANKEQYDLAVYFDYKLGDSVEVAKRLMSSLDANVRHVAQTLISRSDAIAASKASFLEAAKQGVHAHAYAIFRHCLPCALRSETPTRTCR